MWEGTRDETAQKESDNLPFCRLFLPFRSFPFPPLSRCQIAIPRKRSSVHLHPVFACSQCRRGRYVPGQSSFRRFLHWTMPAVGVPIDQLRPDPSYVQLILGAVYDIRICQGIFNGWAAQLDKCVAKKTRSCNRFRSLTDKVENRLSSEQFEERERVIRHHLTLLREDVGWCSRATDAILLCHAQFAYLMAQRIDDASGSRSKRLKCGQDTTELANKINKASCALSQHVTQMQENLKSFVSALEKMKVQKKSSMARRILGWLEHLFSALAKLFALASFVPPFIHPVAFGVRLIAPAASALSEAAADFCRAASGMFLSEHTFSRGSHPTSTCGNTRRERIRGHRVRAHLP